MTKVPVYGRFPLTKNHYFWTIVNFSKIRIKFRFRHRFEKDNSFLRSSFLRWQICLWFKKYRSVGNNDFSDPLKWKDNLVPGIQIGIEAFIFKAWMEIELGNAKQIKIKYE